MGSVGLAWRRLCLGQIRTCAVTENFQSSIPLRRRPAGQNTRCICAAQCHNEHDDAPVTYVHSGLSSGLMSYSRGWAWQQTLLSRRLAAQRSHNQRIEESRKLTHAEKPPDAVITADENANSLDEDRLLLFEHEPVYTLGRGADEENLKFLDDEPDGGATKRRLLSRKSRGAGSARLSVDRIDQRVMDRPAETLVDALADTPSPVLAPNGAPIFRIERGGEVTCHLPGQLVAYPLIDLRRHPYKQDLHWYLRMVEEVVVQTLKCYGIDGALDEENTGVWVGDSKIAAVGVSSSRWITTHGFALNVSPDLRFFDTSVMIPCGIEGRGVTSIVEILKERGESSYSPSVKEVGDVTVQCFEKVFGVSTRMGDILR